MKAKRKPKDDFDVVVTMSADEARQLYGSLKWFAARGEQDCLYVLRRAIYGAMDA